MSPPLGRKEQNARKGIETAVRAVQRPHALPVEKNKTPERALRPPSSMRRFRSDKAACRKEQNARKGIETTQFGSGRRLWLVIVVEKNKTPERALRHYRYELDSAELLPGRKEQNARKGIET